MINESTYIPTFEQFLQESANPINEKKYEYGCSMLYFDFPELFKIQDSIDPDHLSEDDGNGLEKEPHVTLLYGLHSDEIEDNKVLDISSKGIKSIGLGNISLFENEKFDVLKFDVEAPFLYDINKELCKLPHTNNFPDYHPHCTIAYLKPGMGKKYTKLAEGRIYEVFPTKSVYSKTDGTKKEARFDLKK
jgi:2'-5' RNA ligase